MTPAPTPIVAVIGGGQLARMMAEPAAALGIPLRLLAEAPGVSAAQVIPDHVVGDYTDLATLREVTAGCEVVTFDHEHVPTDHLHALESDLAVRPGPDALVHAQDKGVMRDPLWRRSACPAHATHSSPPWRTSRTSACPCVLKTTRGGYDGKGVWFVDGPEDCAAAFESGASILAEERVDFRRELSALVARSPSGQVAAWPVVASTQRDGICHEVVAPAPDLDPDLAVQAQQIAMRVAGELGVTGVLAVELFETQDRRILVNELAMRPHNTGHWTQDGSVTSQFENHLRAVLDLPLGAPDARARWTVMVNILGGARQTGPAVRRLPARDGARPAAARAPLRQGAAARPQGRPRQRLRRRPRRLPRTRPACGSMVRRRPGRGERMTEHDDESPLIGIVMGSDSDWPVMKGAAEACEEFDIPFEADVVSAHRMPDEMLAYGRDAAGRGLKVIIAGAGGAAHLPGMLAAVTPLPVIGVPVPLKYLDGMDSLLSIVQMPAGVPVATVAVGNARNAGLLAVRILAAGDPDLQQKMTDFQAELRTSAEAKGKTVRDAAAKPRRMGF